MPRPWVLSHAIHGDQPWGVQRAAMDAAEGHDRWAHFLEQGLGKTALVLNEFITDEYCKLMFVICPNSFKMDWVMAPKEWGIPNLPARMSPKGDIPSHGMYVINYEAARSAGNTKTFEKLFEEMPVFLVIDEASCLKNPRSLNSKVIMEYAKRATRVRLLNGTPMTQNVLDLFAQLKCAGELRTTNMFAFKHRFATVGGYMGKQITGMKNEDELTAIMKRCSFRALKSDWRDLPPQTDVPVHVEMSPAQVRHYKEMAEEFYTIVSGMDVHADMVLTQLGKLRQISSGFTVQDGHTRLIDPDGKTPKLSATVDLINSGQGKVIVVYHYQDSGRQLFQRLTDEGLNPAMLKGQMKPEDITFTKHVFDTDPGCRVLIAQQTAACMGHTLLGGEGDDRCTRMIFYENNFSLRDRLQMRDRNHRGTQDQPCTYFDLITSKIEEKVIGALSAKKTMADTIDDLVRYARTEDTLRW